MKFFVLLIIISTGLIAQPYFYDFGAGTGSHLADTSTVFLPRPPAGTARVRVGSGGGGFYLENPGIESFGSASELKGLASATSSVNKFSIYGYPGGKTVYVGFLIRFSGGSSGKWYFCSGNGSTYSNNAIFRSDQSFIALRWTYLQPDSIFCEFRKGSSWEKIAAGMSRQNINYHVELYANNSANSLNYKKSGDQQISPYAFDFWLNDTLIGDDLPKALLPDSLIINAFMFYGASSDSNSAIIYLDDIVYSDSVNTIQSSIQNRIVLSGESMGFILRNNYPNPFNPATNIKFVLPERNVYYLVKLGIYNLQGAIVDKINLGYLKSGVHKYRWQAKKLMASGEYIVRLEVDGNIKSRKITYIK
jgi:hypothetical protein